MDSIVASLKLGWEALLLKDEAYEEMGAAESPVVKGFLLILIVGVVIALFGFVGDALAWASTPDLSEIKDIVYHYLTQMPWWQLVARGDPAFVQTFQRWYELGWGMALALTPSPGSAAVGVIMTPVALIIRWLIYGLLAYLFARWLGGTADLSQTLGVLALAVAPQALNLLTFIPYVHLGGVVSVWGILCAYVGLKTAHKLPWDRALWATLLPFALFFAALFLSSCLVTAILGAAIGGGS